jgi:hypothetical protein
VSGVLLLDPKDCLLETGKDFCFGILASNKRTYYIHADDALTCREWCRVIKSVMLPSIPAPAPAPASASASLSKP